MRFLLLQGNRMPRSTYWIAVLCLGILTFIINQIPNPYVDFGLSIPIAYLNLCIACARLRDAGTSAWWVLVVVIPAAVIIVGTLTAIIGLGSLILFIGVIIGTIIGFIFTIAIGVMPTKASQSTEHEQTTGHSYSQQMSTRRFKLTRRTFFGAMLIPVVVVVSVIWGVNSVGHNPEPAPVGPESIGNSSHDSQQSMENGTLSPHHFYANHPAKEHMLELINETRAAAGVPTLTMGDNAAAQLHAENSLANCAGGHWDVNGLKPYMRYSLAGGYQYNIENGFDESDGYDTFAVEPAIQHMMDVMMASPIHLRALLDPWHRKVNVGLAWDDYNGRFYQHFEGDYVRYDTLPDINGKILSVSGQTVNGLSFPTPYAMNLFLFYDPPPQRLTRGQLARASCYSHGNGHPIAAFSPELAPYGVWDEDSFVNRIHEYCPDPYDVPPSSPAPRTPQEAIELHNESNSLFNRPSTSTVPWITASEWTANATEFSIVADISDLLSMWGHGVYTIMLVGVIDGYEVPVSTYSIFHEVEQPFTNGRT